MCQWPNSPKSVQHCHQPSAVQGIVPLKSVKAAALPITSSMEVFTKIPRPKPLWSAEHNIDAGQSKHLSYQSMQQSSFFCHHMVFCCLFFPIPFGFIKPVGKVILLFGPNRVVNVKFNQFNAGGTTCKLHSYGTWVWLV